MSHAHVEHIFNAEKVSDLWLHKEDEKLLRHGAIFQKALKPCPALHFLKDKEKIDLGDRTLSVIHIPGHTDGSILLYDEKHSLLFSGDTVTRRLLYGNSIRVKTAGNIHLLIISSKVKIAFIPCR